MTKEILFSKPFYNGNSTNFSDIDGYYLHIYDSEKNILIKISKKFDKISKEK